MKNNDFDFIKSKFDNVEPPMTDALDKNILKQKILNKSEHQIIQFKQKKNYFKPIAAAAACFVLIFGVVLTSNSSLLNNKVTTFDNYGELNSKISTLEIPPVSGGMGSGEFHVTKQSDEAGVENPNTVQSFDHYIYYAYYDSNNMQNRNKVYIFLTNNGDTEPVSIIDNFISDDFCVRDLFVKENRLVINASASNRTVTKIYDITDKSNPGLISEFEQSGEYFNSKVIDNTIYVSTNYNVSPNSDNSLPYIKQNEETAFVSAKNIALFENAKTAQYAVINSINIDSGKQMSDLKAVLGGSANIYCTKDYMYINEYVDYENPQEISDNNSSGIKLSLKSSRFSYISEKETAEYADNSIDIGKGDYYSGNLYDSGNNIFCIGEDTMEAKDEIILFDSNLNQIDSISFDKTSIMTNSDWLAFNQDKSVYAVPAIFADETKRTYGVITFEVNNNKINITNEFKNNDDNLMYQGKCIIIGEYLYSFNINDNAPDNEKLKIFSYKY